MPQSSVKSAIVILSKGFFTRRFLRDASKAYFVVFDISFTFLLCSRLFCLSYFFPYPALEPALSRFTACCTGCSFADKYIRKTNVCCAAACFVFPIFPVFISRTRAFALYRLLHRLFVRWQVYKKNKCLLRSRLFCLIYLSLYHWGDVLVNYICKNFMAVLV